MQEKRDTNIDILQLSILVFGCILFTICRIEVRNVREIESPNGLFKIIEQSVRGGTAVENLSKLFVLRKDLKIDKYTYPVLITTEGNIVSVLWQDTRNILITVVSESEIRYQVAKTHLFYIHVQFIDITP